MNDLFDISGRTALVTGGSRGIGLMIAQGFVEAGAKVYVSSRKAEVCERVAAELSELGECHALPADLSREDECRRLADEVIDREGGRLDILVNNAGATWGAPFDDFDDAAWDRVLDLNVKGVFHLTRFLRPALAAAGTHERPARVINIGSVDGIRVPQLETYSYSASKAAVHHMTKVLAARLAPDNITVNAIAPGPFESKMTAYMLDDPDTRTMVVNAVPRGRIGTPEDIAGTVIYLASRAGAYLTGALIPLDGGLSTHG